MFDFGMNGLPLIRNAESRSISAENPTGEKSGGARFVPPKENHPASDLGKGWKCKACLPLPGKSSQVLADVDGPGVIQHIWITTDDKLYRDAILRFYWDNEETPSIEVPLGDFFCNGHSLRYNVNSMMVAVNPQGGFNCYWPMPFRKHAKITVENQSDNDVSCFFYQVDYALMDVPEEAAYLHSQWRRSVTSREYPEHIMLDGVKGRGHYVGTFLAWTQLSNGWWGEGELKFFIDGDDEHPTICGTGTEDYFGGAWCFDQGTYNTPFLGYPLHRREPDEVPRHGMYRWHIMDPIHFKKDLSVTVQALGWWPNGRFQPLTDDIASTVFWYQNEPHAKFPQTPPINERWSR